MIRIEISEAQLVKEIKAQTKPKKGKSTWLTDAKATMASNKPGELSESPKWSKVKPVYIRAQHGKCGFCERKLTMDPNYQPQWRDFDVEHYRPKGATKAWPPPALAKRRGLEYPEELPLGEAGASGYYRLTHHHLNYVVSCRACNQAHKRDYFPIAKQRKLASKNPKQLFEQEWPYLIFPLGRLDDDPSELIRFNGLRPEPVVEDPEYHEHWRARITIDFFDLHSEEIIRARAQVICDLGIALTLAEEGSTAAKRELGARQVKRQTSKEAPHSACASAFYKLWNKSSTRARAEKILANADKILETRR